MTSGPTWRTAGRAGELLVLLGCGAVLGALGAFESGWTLRGWWVGLIAALAVTGLSAALICGGLRSPLAAPSVGVGWLVAVGWLSIGRPEGDVVIPGSARGYVFLIGGLLAFLPAGWIGARLQRRSRSGPRTGADGGFTPAGEAPIAGQ